MLCVFFFFLSNRMPGTNSSVFIQSEVGAAVFSCFKVVNIKTCRVIKSKPKTGHWWCVKHEEITESINYIEMNSCPPVLQGFLKKNK